MSEAAEVRLKIDWKALNLKEKRVISHFPEIQNYRKYLKYELNSPIEIEAKGVRFIIISKY